MLTAVSIPPDTVTLNVITFVFVCGGPSITCTSTIPIDAPSSLLIVLAPATVAPPPVNTTSRPPTDRLLRTRLKASWGSTFVSPVTSTVTVCVVVLPAVKLTAWPSTAV